MPTVLRMSITTYHAVCELRAAFQRAIPFQMTVQMMSTSKRSFILIMFADYVRHVRTLLETGHHDFYRKGEKLQALERCSKYAQWLDDKKLEEICKVILSLQEDMRRILPSAANPSAAKCESKIIDMVVFCKRESGSVPMPMPIAQTTT